jgi:hypothetical protein
MKAVEKTVNHWQAAREQQQSSSTYAGETVTPATDLAVLGKHK